MLDATSSGVLTYPSDGVMAFDSSDEFGAYAKNPKPYFDTMKDFGYTKDSIVDLRDKKVLVNL